MAIALAVLLGVVQGLTEFLPISSSGHLRLMAAVFGIDEPQTLFDVCVHAGTLGAVIAVYRKEIWSIAKALLRPSWNSPRFRLAIYILVGTVPAGVIGILFGETLETHLASVSSVGVFLLINGTILQASRGLGKDGRDLDSLTFRDAVLIGLAQSFALFRGVSRSGTTITMALAIGVRRDTAAAFSFLLSIPAIGGAVVLKTSDALQSTDITIIPLVLGTLTSAASGYLALKYLVRLVRSGQLHHFGWYCWGIGAIAIITSLT
jgi:undecaprenyl-diphosphatase